MSYASPPKTKPQINDMVIHAQDNHRPAGFIREGCPFVVKEVSDYGLHISVATVTGRVIRGFMDQPRLSPAIKFVLINRQS